MPKARVSKNYRITIPKELREELRIRPGQFLVASVKDGKFLLERPPRSIKELYGIAKGMKWRKEDRDRKDRF